MARIVQALTQPNNQNPDCTETATLHSAVDAIEHELDKHTPIIPKGVVGYLSLIHI